ncbi:replication protein A 70 kDa DNA-binding subunit-like [Drosophila rhopaloa]|uniref:Replication protein A 70 kDa DNA-binding subunit-like n=1 Tax=Drosophila rhopaloa TaxID=1041015 RepID=A0A6P4FA34_DRORH|nr:replication protein A 70 kDa DNA-binding subunit-like [Drosophila rhopaloa]
MNQTTITPISGLSSTQLDNPTIRACVGWKSNITPWRTGDKVGTIFLMNLLDESGEITGVVFDDLCNTFYGQIREGSVCLFTNFDVTLANERYKLLKNPIQISFIEETVVQLEEELCNTPFPKYNFLPLSEVYKTPDGEPVDAIGICIEVADVEERGGHIIREIWLLDADEEGVMLNLWENEATSFSGEPGDVIVVKGARVKEHDNQKKLNADWYTMVQINPETPDAISMLEWYENM